MKTPYSASFKSPLRRVLAIYDSGPPQQGMVYCPEKTLIVSLNNSSICLGTDRDEDLGSSRKLQILGSSGMPPNPPLQPSNFVFDDVPPFLQGHDLTFCFG
ncbi:MAG: hypothetical protein ACE5GQ_08460 [Nitrospinales bacterium]